MKIKKTFILVFISTFIVGSIFLDPTKKVSNLEIAEKLPHDILQLQQPIEVASESEILEENNDWLNERQKTFATKLLETGNGFHGDEIEAKSGEIWLGLFEENGKSFLELTKLSIRRVHDSVVDGYYEKEATKKTGKSVFVNKKSKPVFLLKNARMLSEGKINTLYRYDDESENSGEEDHSIRNGFVKEFKIGEVSYFVRAKKGKNKKQEDILALVIESGGISQTIHSTKSIEGDYLGVLYWAGDLDRDGKPDFYFDLSLHDNVIYKNLFLSSQAKKGKLVKKVATFSTVGC